MEALFGTYGAFWAIYYFVRFFVVVLEWFCLYGYCLIEYILSIHSQPFPRKPTFADIRRLRLFYKYFHPIHLSPLISRKQKRMKTNQNALHICCSMPYKAKKCPTNLGISWTLRLRGWDLNLMTSGLWARRATRLLYPAIFYSALGGMNNAGNRARTGT